MHVMHNINKVIQKHTHAHTHIHTEIITLEYSGLSYTYVMHNNNNLIMKHTKTLDSRESNVTRNTYKKFNNST
jgi:hypothetical protein